MKTYRTSRTGLFLIELIISIFFFIISAAVIVMLFARSYEVSSEAVNINNALLYTRNISEIFLGSDDGFKLVRSVYQDTAYESDNGSILLLFDQNWEPVFDDADAKYAVCAANRIIAPYSYIDIYVYKYSDIGKSVPTDNTDEYIYQQSIKKYIGGI